jgi:hypothetical protein
MIKRKKGHFLVTKTQRTKLLSDKPDWLNSTQLLFNQVIEFYVGIYNKYPELASVPSPEIYSTIEPITVKTKTRAAMKLIKLASPSQLYQEADNLLVEEATSDPMKLDKTGGGFLLARIVIYWDRRTNRPKLIQKY